MEELALSHRATRKFLISIKPVYVELIASGKKKFELRRKAPKFMGRALFFIYTTMPVGRVEYVFSSEGVEVSTPNRLWEKHSDVFGISKEAYDEYFCSRVSANAIVITEVKKLANPIALTDLNAHGVTVPQSYRELSNEFVDQVIFGAS